MRIATFNLENLDDRRGEQPTLAERIRLMRPQLLRLDADILCLQEIHGQGRVGARDLRALDELLEETPYAEFERVSTLVEGEDQVYDERNLVVLSRYPIERSVQYRHDFAPPPQYRRVTAVPPDTQAVEISWERPIQRAGIRLPDGRLLEVLNLHLKSRIPADIPGGKVDAYTWRNASAYAEGSFVSAVARVGQALEARLLVDRIFDEDPDALVAVCGDLNGDAEDIELLALRGDLEDTGNPADAGRVLVLCERNIPESTRYSLLHQGQGVMFDHILASRALLAGFTGAEVHNELLHDESAAFATDEKFPESDHAPVVADFGLIPSGR